MPNYHAVVARIFLPILAGSASLRAETITWTGGAGDGEWATAANWDLARVPAAGDDVVIADPLGTLIVTYRRGATAINSLSCDAAFIFTTTTGLPARLEVASSALFSSNLTVYGGTLTGAGKITVHGLFHWAGGTITSPTPASPVTVAGTLVMSSSVQKALGRRLVLEGGASGSWSGLGVLSVSRQSVIEIRAGAIFELLNDVNIFETPGVGAASLVNAGTLRKRGGTGASTLDVFVDNAGVFRIDRGVASITHGFRQTAGELLQSGGRVRCESLLSLEGGALRGVGTVEAGISNTGATLRPGLGDGLGPAVGALNVAGPYAQSVDGWLEIEFDQSGESIVHDVVTFDELAVIDGQVALRFLAAPPLSGSFIVATAAPLVGDAREVETYCLEPAADVVIDLTAAEAIVTFTDETCAADLDGDGQVTLQDLARFLAGFGLTDASRGMGDLDGDCDIDLADLVLLLSAFGSGCP
ncbi:MAG: hypothetical protein IT450_05910 [Phycisphaerales bacterium]|nr:hypothetical protein [Phycisphaerales bacterium]